MSIESQPSSLSLIIPVRNERARLDLLEEGLRHFLRLCASCREVLIVDDGSVDGSASELERRLNDLPGVRILRRPHQGKGGALREGVSQARCEWVLLTDADWSVSPEDCLLLLPPHSPTRGLVIASRELESSERIQEPLRRHGLGRAFNALVQALILPGIEDSQCGCKAMSAATARRLFQELRLSGWAFDVELLRRARDADLPIHEVPVTWQWHPLSQVQPLRDGLAMARDILKLYLTEHGSTAPRRRG